MAILDTSGSVIKRTRRNSLSNGEAGLTEDDLQLKLECQAL